MSKHIFKNCLLTGIVAILLLGTSVQVGQASRPGNPNHYGECPLLIFALPK